jgi:ASC-1-like (ASCH) protein
MERKELLMETRPIGKEYVRADIIQEALKKAKGDVLKEFEKVCPTDKSFDRIVKDMHDIFDQLREELKRVG